MAEPNIAVPRTGNPYGAYNFGVRIGDLPVIYPFQSISGLDSENAVIEYREGASATPGNFPIKLAGLERYPNLVMRRGIDATLSLWGLRKMVRDAVPLGPAGRPVVDLRITLNNEKQGPVLQWKVTNAMLVKLVGPSLDASTSAVAIETAEWAYDRLEEIS